MVCVHCGRFFEPTDDERLALRASAFAFDRDQQQALDQSGSRSEDRLEAAFEELEHPASVVGGLSSGSTTLLFRNGFVGGALMLLATLVFLAVTGELPDVDRRIWWWG